ncbi:glycosyltransferase family 4 protein [Nocardioides sp. Bht2]|uniref:glycosyltransferase family 4 protein n=1 Tax=Nocardioides sp. Bht2 TaxID=3392297 RepID=UPI0039B660CD
MRGKIRPSGGAKKHIVALSWRDAWHPEGGGSERWLLEVSERLAEQHRVTVFTARYPGSAERETINGVEYRRRGGRFSVFVHGALGLLTRRFGAVDAVLEVHNGMPFLARLFTRARVVVLVHHVHREQWPVAGQFARFGWFLESQVAPRVNRHLDYLTVSDVTRMELAELGVTPARVALAWNGTQEVPAGVAETTRTAYPSLVVLGRLVPHKQVEHAIRSVAALLPRFPDLQLRIVGSGWWEDELRAEIARLNVDHAVTLVGHVDEDEKYQELARAWVHLLPSLKEGWGLSIIEAAQVATPSIAFASAGGVRDSILDGATGLLAGDDEQFTAFVDRLLSDHTLRAELGQKAQIRSAEFTWDATRQVVQRTLLPGA